MNINFGEDYIPVKKKKFSGIFQILAPKENSLLNVSEKVSFLCHVVNSRESCPSGSKNHISIWESSSWEYDSRVTVRADIYGVLTLIGSVPYTLLI